MGSASARRCAVVAVIAAVTLAGAAVPAGALPARAVPAPTPAAAAGSAFTQVSPVRVLDTRTGLGAPAAPVGPARTITVDLSARMPATATAVVLNVTGTEPTAATFVTVFPAGQPRPLASSLNLVPGLTAPNQVTVQVPPDRRITLYNNAGSVHLVADLAGYYASGAGSRFTVLQPDRAFDSRTSGTGAPIGPVGTVTVDLTGRVPDSATAVTVNLTGTEPTAATFVTAYPAGQSRPLASNLNLDRGVTRPNLVTVALGAQRRITLYNNAGSVHLIVDLAGFYTPDYGASFFPNAPRRVLDTRTGTGTGGSTAPLPPSGQLDTGLEPGLFRDGTTAAVLNLTGVEPNAPTFVTAWRRFNPRPFASNLNLATGQTAPNAAVVGVGPLGSFSLYSHNAFVHVVADVAGIFAFDRGPCGPDCVYAWGDNTQGQLGTGQPDFGSANPQPVEALSGVTALAGGFGDNGYALRSNGTVVAWGDNWRGQLGNGWTAPFFTPVAAPVPVVGLTNVTAIAAGRDAAYALKSDGTVWAWGAGGSGQLGSGGPAPDSSRPVRVPLPPGVVAIAAGEHNGYALLPDGTVRAWGRNNEGQLGIGVADDGIHVPQQVQGLDDATAISGGVDNAYALRAGGTMVAWGENRLGQLGTGAACVPGTGANCRATTPVPVAGLTGVTAMAADRWRAFAVTSGGTAWAWGDNRDGGLGIGVECDWNADIGCRFPAPREIDGISGVTAVAGFTMGGYALLSDGTVWGWGANVSGQLANADAGAESTVPVRVGDLTGASAIAGGRNAGRALLPTPGG